MPVPYTFASATAAIPLSNLDSNFATAVTIGNTAVQLGNTITTLNNVTINSSTLSSCNIAGGGANGVVYINSSNVATANASVLAFDGTNLGVGVTPSSWSSYKVVQLNGGALASYSSGQYMELTQNAYYNGNWIYSTTAPATDYQQYNGQHIWRIAPSGNVGSTITFTQAMTLNNSGTLVFGVSGQGIQFTNSSASTNSTLNDYETGTWTVTDQSGAGLTFTNATGQYTKIGNLVYYSLDINFPSTASTANVILSLPFTSFNTGGSISPGGAYQTYNPAGTYTWYTGSNQAYVRPYTNAGVAVTNITFSSKEIAIVGVYKASF